MKKNYLTSCGLQMFIIIASVLLFPVAAHNQELTDAQKQERCQNNKNRIAELETQLKVINAELSQVMEEKEMVYVRDQLSYIKKLKTKLAQSSEASWDPKSVTKISADYNFNMDDCLERNKNKHWVYSGARPCLTELEKLIAKKINKAESLNRPALLAKKNEIDKQLATHRNNLVALRCDQPADKEKTADINGDWNALGFVYTIAQSGTNFTWYVAKIKQKAEGTITGKSVSATWFHQDGSVDGSATGTIKVDASGRATSIGWSNGVVFTRK